MVKMASKKVVKKAKPVGVDLQAKVKELEKRIVDMQENAGKLLLENIQLRQAGSQLQSRVEEIIDELQLTESSADSTRQDIVDSRAAVSTFLYTNLALPRAAVLECMVGADVPPGIPLVDSACVARLLIGLLHKLERNL
jgi:regulator of replication initiation timing